MDEEMEVRFLFHLVCIPFADILIRTLSTKETILKHSCLINVIIDFSRIHIYI